MIYIKIGVIGNEAEIQGFLSLGFEVKSANSKAECEAYLEELKATCGVVYVTTKLYTDKYKNDPSFTVIPIPSQNDNSNFGEERLKKFVEKAVGADIL